MICVTISFQILVFNIRTILNMILSVCSFSLHVSFFVFDLINDTIFAGFFVGKCCNSLDKLTSSFWLPVYICICESNLFDPGSWTVDINWYIYIALINSIESIYQFFAMPRCTYPSINYDVVTLRHNLNKVYCIGTYVLFGTTIIVFSYLNKWCC